MKKLIKVIIMGGVVAALSACSNQNPTPTQETTVSQAAETQTTQAPAADTGNAAAESESGNQDNLIQIREQGSFSVGGTVIEVPGEYTSQNFDSWQPYEEGQTYHGDHASVFYQIPAQARDTSMVFLHGAGESGRSWITTPDGRDGFSNIFVTV